MLISCSVTTALKNRDFCTIGLYIVESFYSISAKVAMLYTCEFVKDMVIISISNNNTKQMAIWLVWIVRLNTRCQVLCFSSIKLTPVCTTMKKHTCLLSTVVYYTPFRLKYMQYICAASDVLLASV